jgi:hypothetical protein
MPYVMGSNDMQDDFIIRAATLNDVNVVVEFRPVGLFSSSDK